MDYPDSRRISKELEKFRQFKKGIQGNLLRLTTVDVPMAPKIFTFNI